jgi:ribose-phosphate pyrophosphokinase
VIVAATHGLLLGDAAARLAAGGVRTIFVTDTVPPREPRHPAVQVVTVAPLVASSVRRVRARESLEALYGHGARA